MSRKEIYYSPDTSRRLRRGIVFFTALKYRPTISITELLRKEEEWQSRLRVADAIAHHYDVAVWAPPVFDNQFDDRYLTFYSDAPVAGKMPDLFFDDLFWEMKSHEGRFNSDNFTDMLWEGKRQSPNILIRMNHDYDIELLKRRVKNYVHRSNSSYTVKNQIDRLIIVDAHSILHEV